MKKIIAIVTHVKDKELFKIVDIGAYGINDINKFVSAYAENKYFNLDIRISNE